MREPRRGAGEPRLTVAPLSVQASRRAPTRWDLLAFGVVMAGFVLVALGSRGVLGTLEESAVAAASLDPTRLPWYAARTSLRMIVALVLSTLFTFGYATLAAKNRRARAFLLPLLDILQSVPILGFVSAVVVLFMGLTPGRVLGAELVAVFAIFTSQVWNMTFSLYNSLVTLPRELDELARSYRLGPWMRFWRVELPFALPPLVWNAMMSMSGGWFFVVAAESISVGRSTVDLPGVGTYIAAALTASDLGAVGWAVLTMAVVILLYDVLLFRPLVAWSARFRYDTTAGHVEEPRSLVLEALRRSRWVDALAGRAARLARRRTRPRPDAAVGAAPPDPTTLRRRDRAWGGFAAVVATASLLLVARYLQSEVSPAEVGHVLLLGVYTMVRVLVLVVLASLVWVPVGVMVGLRPRLTAWVQPLAQFLAAFPANLLFPLAVWAIVRYGLDPNVWLSPLMILGTQWYILFNVTAGAAGIPGELRDVTANLQLKGWLWWRKLGLPAVFPTFLTGAITASGGAWNASIVAELVHWGNDKVEAAGLGAYIVKATEAGDQARIVLGIAVMSLFVVVLNRAFWQPLQRRASQGYRLE